MVQWALTGEGTWVNPLHGKTVGLVRFEEEIFIKNCQVKPCCSEPPELVPSKLGMALMAPENENRWDFFRLHSPVVHDLTIFGGINLRLASFWGPKSTDAQYEAAKWGCFQSTYQLNLCKVYTWGVP